MNAAKVYEKVTYIDFLSFLSPSFFFFFASKVRSAEREGAIGIILFLDKETTGPQEGGQVFPDSIWMSGSAIQRGTVAYGRGDPLTPGYPSIGNLYNFLTSLVMSHWTGTSLAKTHCSVHERIRRTIVSNVTPDAVRCLVHCASVPAKLPPNKCHIRSHITMSDFYVTESETCNSFACCCDRNRISPHNCPHGSGAAHGVSGTCPSGRSSKIF